ncbi:quinoprotein glucose dehydrogenase [Actinomycetospora sp. TBRC 11914]|nr:quinoprotein glucose dehydrogenase [Actinomycetospora sp. TBRC 11914]
MRVLTTGLAAPWELVWGPDGWLWVTEKIGKRVDRISPADGTRTVALTVPDASASGAQDGLLGLAFAGDSAFVAYTYDAVPPPAEDLRAKIVRYHRDPGGTLSAPVEVISGLPASHDHDGGRLILGPDQKLWYSLGDQGNNQFDRACQPIRSQDLPTAAQVAAKDWSTYAGKVLRIDLDGSVPSDNPVIHGVRSHVVTYGHRNPQGLAVGPGGRIFSDEHGPKSDDEINLLRPGANYGWPYVSGFRDDQAYRYADWSAAPDCPQLTYDDYQDPPSVPRGPPETVWNSPDYVEPLRTMYTVPTGHNFQDPQCTPDDYYLCWPSIAPAALDYLPAEGAPDPAVANALLVPALKTGSVFVFPLTGDGGSLRGDTIQLFRTRNRYRDVALSADHTHLYVATDSDGQAGPQSGSRTGTLDDPGSVLEFPLTGLTAPTR